MGGPVSWGLLLEEIRYCVMRKCKTRASGEWPDYCGVGGV